MNRRLFTLLAALLLALGAGMAAPTAAQANSACPSSNICAYPCYLSGSCTMNHINWASQTSCINVGVDSNIYSVKNNTPYRYRVYHDTTCSYVGSYFYAYTSGNMNWEWAGDGIGSYRRG